MITTSVDKFIGAHLTQQEKELIREDARKTMKGNMSKWIRKVAREELKRAGYQLEDQVA